MKRIDAKGEVSERLIVQVDLWVAELDIPDDAEVVVNVNGRTVKRMSIFQARRMGLVKDNA